MIDPAKPTLKLGLDVHLESITAVVQKDHANPHAPRSFTNDQLLAQVKNWIAQGHQVYCVQESCGFGFTLHRRLVEAGAQSFLITPVALNGQRKTDKLDARALCLRLSRWLDGNRDELAPIRFHNRKQIGSFTGCCPGEHSSGGKRRVGAIDPIGNGQVRALLVEAVWRFLRWQPDWKVIALARQLAMDLWRWRTGCATMEDLGWIAAYPPTLHPNPPNTSHSSTLGCSTFLWLFGGAFMVSEPILAGTIPLASTLGRYLCGSIGEACRSRRPSRTIRPGNFRGRKSPTSYWC